MNLRTISQGMILALVALSLLSPGSLYAKTGEKKKGEGETEKTEESKKESKELLRVPTQAREVLKNKVSNIEFFSSNYGIFGLDVAAGRAGGLWPRGSNKAYIFGGGVWFGARKIRPNSRGGQDTNKLQVVGYNPNSGASWMVPGRIGPDLLRSPIDESAAAISKYRLYLSTDYSNFSGEPLDPRDASGPNWPIWDTNPGDTLKQSRYFGNYIEDVNLRNRATFPKGPAFISGEDIFSTYKDTDLSRYEKLPRDTAIKKGYPIGIQVEQTLYSWGFGRYGDFMFISYEIINKSGENLLDCYMAPAMDMDMGVPSNDRAKIFIEDPSRDTLNLAIQYTDAESSGKFGYIGFDFLESPAIDPTNGYLRKDRRVFTEQEQIGLTTFQSWPIEEDKLTPESRYDFMSARERDNDDRPGDRRFMMATGPFNMAPGDTARVVVGVIFAFGRGEVATGLPADMQNLLALDTFAQRVYDQSFLAPLPPDAANVSWRPLNNGVELSWDEASERSVDKQERGLDFSGYTIRRSRTTVANTSSSDSVSGWNLGWKTIGSFRIPAFPDTTLRLVAKQRNNLGILGPWSRLPMLADTISFSNRFYKVFRIDTVKRPGLPDLLIKGDSIGMAPIVEFSFDPYDDENDDSTLFNDGRYGDKFKNKAIRDIVREAITEIMDSVTSGRRFVDVGDDNGDGRIEESPDNLAQNEKLINGVDYYYEVLAFDAGSAEGTPSKSNSGQATKNQIIATPEAPAAGEKAQAVVISSEGLGGIHNFRFIVEDQDRLGQMFGGDTLDFEFQPLTRPYAYGFPQYFYATEVLVRSRRQQTELMRFVIDYSNDFTDRSDLVNRVLDSTYGTYRDTVKKVNFNGRLVRVPYAGTYIADPLRPAYGTVGVYKNTFGIAFDFNFLQFGDSLRLGKFGDSTLTRNAIAVTAGDAQTNVAPGKSSVGNILTGGMAEVRQRIPSIGQAKIEIEFLPGGTESITYTKGQTRTFNVEYLNVKVKNIASYAREVFDVNGTKSETTVQYNYEFPADPAMAIKADTTAVLTEITRVIDPGKYALYAFGMQNVQGLDFKQRSENQFARQKVMIGQPGVDGEYIGTPGRYYRNRYVQDTATLSFVHKLVVNGTSVFLDFAGMGSNEGRPTFKDFVPATLPPDGTDFEAGDKLVLEFVGGTLGLPQPGAKVSVAIPQVKPTLDAYTDELLDQISIAPNPYLINHIGQPSNSDRRLYFTRLPEQCTIQIYTESGELMQTIEHRAATGGQDGRIAVEAYDLLTSGNRLAQSQLLIARISTPNGKETIKKVAVIVGGFRLVPR